MICYDNETDESICEAQSNLKYTHLPDKFWWSEEAKIKYQEAFHSHNVKNNPIDIDEQLEAGCMDVQSMIDNITDVIVLAGNKSLVRKALKPTKGKTQKVNKK